MRDRGGPHPCQEDCPEAGLRATAEVHPGRGRQSRTPKASQAATAHAPNNPLASVGCSSPRTTCSRFLPELQGGSHKKSSCAPPGGESSTTQR
eukprot:3382848-Alexandrium_andersonii.AAC.1